MGDTGKEVRILYSKPLADPRPLSDSHLITTLTSIPTRTGLVYFLPQLQPGRASSVSEVVRGPFSRPYPQFTKPLAASDPIKNRVFLRVLYVEEPKDLKQLLELDNNIQSCPEIRQTGDARPDAFRVVVLTVEEIAKITRALRMSSLMIPAKPQARIVDSARLVDG